MDWIDELSDEEIEYLQMTPEEQRDYDELTWMEEQYEKDLATEDERYEQWLIDNSLCPSCGKVDCICSEDMYDDPDPEPPEFDEEEYYEWCRKQSKRTSPASINHLKGNHSQEVGEEC